MELLLTVKSYGGAPPDRPASLRVGAGGCTLGRNPGNDLALSDPDRLVSGLHAQIELRPDGVWLTDKSTNGTFLNHAAERLASSEPTRLQDGDILGIGPYEISVSLVENPLGSTPADPIFGTGPGPGADLDLSLDLDLPGLVGPGPAQDIMALLGGTPGQPVARPEPAQNRFADAQALDPFLAGPAPEAEAAMARPRPTPVEHVYFQPPSTQPIPDDYDLLGDLQPTPRPGPGPSAGVGAPAPLGDSAFLEAASPPPRGAPDLPAAPADLTVPPDRRRTPASSATEGLLDAAPGSAPEPLAGHADSSEPLAFPDSPAFSDHAASGPSPATPEPLAPTDPFGLAEAHAPATPGSFVEPRPEPMARPEPSPLPRPAIPQPGLSPIRHPAAEPLASTHPSDLDPAAAAGPTRAAAPSADGAHAGLDALLAGLGTGDPARIQDPEALLRDTGTLLRALVTGLTATMMVRARFKSELRVGMTTLRPTENNPFKFSVGADEALERLLLRPNPGFLPPVQAAQEAFEDIQAHEMAIIAGLRAALRALLARFEPAALEARLDPASGFDKLLPMARKSRIWEQFTAEYGRVAADAEEDFMQLFGEAFTRAYEDQIYRLSQTRGRHPPAR